MAVVRRKIPNQAASGADTFSDFLVGNQRTSGNIVNETFTLDKVIPERDVKNFKTSPFSDFLTLDTLKEQQDETTTDENPGASIKKEKIKFRGGIDNAGKSLFGSLKLRLEVSIKDIITRFPAGFLIDSTSPTNINNYSINNISYDSVSDTTSFNANVNICRFRNNWCVILI